MIGTSSKLPNGIILGDRYRIIKQIGQGGFGRTYLAEDTHRYDEKCVLKEFAPLVENDADLQKAEKLFEREAGILYKLKHERIPEFKALLRTKVNGKKLLFLVQEYIEGKTYYDLLQEQGKFTESEVIELITELLPVLEYIHQQNLIHRDISPDNLIYRRADKKPALIDFGCVKLAANAVSRSQGFLVTLVGKKGYAPEEQMRSGSAFPCSDLYALAATAVTLLTGETPDKLYDAHQGKWHWQERAKVSPHLAKVLHKMLAYRPSDRYQNASEVLKILNKHQPSLVNSLISRIQTLVVAPKNRVSSNNNSSISHIEKQPTLQFTRRITNNLSRVSTKAIAISQVVSRQVNKLPYARRIRPWQWVLITIAAAIIPGIITFSTIQNIRSAISLSGIRNSVSKTIYVIRKTINLPVSITSRERNQQQDIYQRVQALNIDSGIFFGQVDREFYRQYPEMENVALTNSTEHLKYRRRWYQIAEDLLRQREREL
ncbi:Serine/threonine protein kinase [Hyella patelloides LEGE 07179]|uniref:non-specific serine/threonine protein kinase n=1 Tax=Hyella patelloides LEGE 07179 TaxID=945734 RepID=A0A563VU13_9CYAN|nr:serine/threonine-protein kinase [Hyella patelloides]VEP14962.1 Serine/threonine protein kinase [Hyella patelloides LEGE 07179]